MITTLVRLSNHFAYGDTPEGQDFDQLRRQGFWSVIDLRTHKELGEGRDFSEVARIARHHELSYYHLSVAEDAIQPAHVENLLHRMPTLPTPLYAFPGERAGVLLVLHNLVDEGISGEHALSRATELGFETQDEKLREFIREYVDKHPIQPY